MPNTLNKLSKPTKHNLTWQLEVASSTSTSRYKYKWSWWQVDGAITVLLLLEFAKSHNLDLDSESELEIFNWIEFENNHFRFLPYFNFQRRNLTKCKQMKLRQLHHVTSHHYTHSPHLGWLTQQVCAFLLLGFQHGCRCLQLIILWWFLLQLRSSESWRQPCPPKLGYCFVTGWLIATCPTPGSFARKRTTAQSYKRWRSSSRLFIDAHFGLRHLQALSTHDRHDTVWKGTRIG